MPTYLSLVYSIVAIPETLNNKLAQGHAIPFVGAGVSMMKERGLTKTVMAERMHTSRRQLDRLFDPAIQSVTLDTLRRAASAVGRTLRVELV